ncbi:hypothetical protein CLOM_g8741, partial [Closterium sp. NIES-68]
LRNWSHPASYPP